MTLHIFNPEHDIALASGLTNFTAPLAGRRLCADLGFLPVLWAEAGDCVLAPSDSKAPSDSPMGEGLSLRECVTARTLTLTSMLTRDRQVPVPSVHFVDGSQLARLPIDRIDPWGWDGALVAMLRRKGVDASLLPTGELLAQIRALSHRRTAARLLPTLRLEGTVGEAFETTTLGEVEALRMQYGQLVLKAPWSSSGRGLRFIDSSTPIFQPPLSSWFARMVSSQGSVMVEPLYNKVRDFGMEFEATNDGIRYLGLSLFDTKNGAYTGNVLATEAAKQEILSRYVAKELLGEIRQGVIRCLDLGDYRGPFGIDMMVVEGMALHPCVEINLRRTMGHVALALERMVNPEGNDDKQGVMTVLYDGTNYRLEITVKS